jgi:hypothetical protein
MLNRFLNTIITNSFRLKWITGTTITFSAIEKTLSSLLYSKYKNEIKNKDNTIEQENSTKIIHQAFKDIGYKGELLVEYKKYQSKTLLSNEYPVTMSAGSFYTLENKPATYIEVQYASEAQLRNLKNTYALSGHEAIHSLHHHSSIGTVTTGIIWGLTLAMFLKRKNLSMFLLRQFPALFIANYFIQHALGKLKEIDADISSTRKLGTGYLLSEAFENFEKHNHDVLVHNGYNLLSDDEKSMVDEEDYIKYLEILDKMRQIFFDEHPTLRTRINLIKFFNKTEREPLLLQSPVYEEIQLQYKK